MKNQLAQITPLNGSNNRHQKASQPASHACHLRSTITRFKTIHNACAREGKKKLEKYDNDDDEREEE